MNLESDISDIRHLLNTDNKIPVEFSTDNRDYQDMQYGGYDQILSATSDFGPEMYGGDLTDDLSDSLNKILNKAKEYTGDAEKFIKGNTPDASQVSNLKNEAARKAREFQNKAILSGQNSMNETNKLAKNVKNDFYYQGQKAANELDFQGQKAANEFDYQKNQISNNASNYGNQTKTNLLNYGDQTKNNLYNYGDQLKTNLSGKLPQTNKINTADLRATQQQFMDTAQNVRDQGQQSVNALRTNVNNFSQGAQNTATNLRDQVEPNIGAAKTYAQNTYQGLGTGTTVTNDGFGFNNIAQNVEKLRQSAMDIANTTQKSLNGLDGISNSVSGLFKGGADATNVQSLSDTVNSLQNSTKEIADAANQLSNSGLLSKTGLFGGANYLGQSTPDNAMYNRHLRDRSDSGNGMYTTNGGYDLQGGLYALSNTSDDFTYDDTYGGKSKKSKKTNSYMSNEIQNLRKNSYSGATGSEPKKKRAPNLTILGYARVSRILKDYGKNPEIKWTDYMKISKYVWTDAIAELKKSNPEKSADVVTITAKAEELAKKSKLAEEYIARFKKENGKTQSRIY